MKELILGCNECDSEATLKDTYGDKVPEDFKFCVFCGAEDISIL